MKFTLSWLKDHLETDATLEEIVDTLTKAGLEVERAENRASALKGFVIASVVEAKPQGHTLAGVESQSVKYAGALPSGVPAHRLPLPFCYTVADPVLPSVQYDGPCSP